MAESVCHHSERLAGPVHRSNLRPPGSAAARPPDATPPLRGPVRVGEPAGASTHARRRAGIRGLMASSTKPARVRITGDLHHPVVPDGAVRITRPGRWGNPHKIGPDCPADVAVARFRADLFAGRPWVLTPGPTTPEDDLRRLRRFVETLGAEPHCLDAAEHDRVFSFVSHLPQLAISALMEVAGSRAGAQGLALAGDGLRGSTRIAASTADIWIDILATNRANITGAIDALIAALGALRDDESGRTLRQTFERAAELKQVLDRRRS